MAWNVLRGPIGSCRCLFVSGQESTEPLLESTIFLAEQVFRFAPKLPSVVHLQIALVRQQKSTKSTYFQIKQELATEREQIQKTKMTLEAEIASLKKVKEECERSLKVHHVSAQADRQAANEMHFETIKVVLSVVTSRSHLYFSFK